MYNISQIIASLQFVPRIANTHYYYQTYGDSSVSKNIGRQGRPTDKNIAEKIAVRQK